MILENSKMANQLSLAYSEIALKHLVIVQKSNGALEFGCADIFFASKTKHDGAEDGAVK